MKKVEQFIQENTRNCSNEILSPYPQINKDVRKVGGEPAKEFSPWLTLDHARKAVEIAREEMIKKVCNFITEKLFFKDNMLYTNIKSKIVEDIKQAMNDE